jgi:transcriptional regulator with XRE-family HTH domain
MLMSDNPEWSADRWLDPLREAEHPAFLSSSERADEVFARFFAQQLRAVRNEKGWSQQELAARMAKAGVPWIQSMVAKVEQGSRTVSIGEAIVLADVLDVRLEDLVTLRRYHVMQDSELWEQLRFAQDALERAGVTLAGLQATQQAAQAQLTEVTAAVDRAEMQRYVMESHVRLINEEMERRRGIAGKEA